MLIIRVQPAITARASATEGKLGFRLYVFVVLSWEGMNCMMRRSLLACASVIPEPRLRELDHSVPTSFQSEDQRPSTKLGTRWLYWSLFVESSQWVERNAPLDAAS